MKAFYSLISRFSYMIPVVLFFAMFPSGTIWAQATCGTPSSISNFEVDGDVRANTLTGNFGDSWFFNSANPGSGIGVIGTTAATATPAISSAQFNTIIQTAPNVNGRNKTYLQRMSVPNLSVVNGKMLIDAFACRDYISTSTALDSTCFIGGAQKNGDNPTTWTIGTGSIQTKNDIIDIGAHIRRQVTARSSSGAINDLWLMAYVTKLGTGGDSYTDIEVYRTIPYVDPVTGNFTNTGPAATGGHTAFNFANDGAISSPGDLIICINYSATGGVASIRVWCDINNLDGSGNGWAYFNTLPNRPFNFTGDFITGLNANGYGYAEIQSLTGASCLVYSVLNSATIPAGDWGNLTGSGAAYDATIQPGQLVNVAMNFTDFGLDFGSISGPCFNVFGGVIFKSRSSSAWSSELKDFMGPVTLGNFSEIQANAGPDKTLTCVSGTVTLNGSSQTPGAIYNWTTPNGNIVSGANTANAIVNAPGTYVLMTENPTLSTCTAYDTVIVTLDQIPPVANAGPDMQITCSAGSINLNGSSTTPGAQFQWTAIDDGNIVSGGTTLSPVVNATGCYVLTVTNPVNGCTSSDTACVTLNNSVPSISGVIQNNISCYAGCNGSIFFTVTGGQSPYTYVWSQGSTSQSITNLCAGSYTVTVSGSNGCTVTQTFNITQPSASLSVSVAATQNVSCQGGNNGTALAAGNGGTAPYTYAWNNGATTASISGLSAGTYTVTVTDNNGCTSVNNVSITQPSSSVTGSLIVTSTVSCFGGNNGAINLTPSGGTPSYSYLWSNGAISQDLNGLSAGTYTVTITDANGCTFVQSIAVTQPAATLSSTASMTQSVACYGGNNGIASVTSTGGTSPYSYLWNNGATTQSVSGLASGTYTVTVTDANGCTSTNAVFISQPSAVLSTSLTSSQNVNCFGGNNGNINISVAGGTSPYTYLWNTGATTQDVSGLISGSYTVTVTDSRGCTSINTVTITQPAASVTSTIAVTQNVSCYTGNNGAINLTPSGGSTPYTYAWNNGAGTQDLSGLAAGTYTVTITDANGCTTVNSATITQPAATVSSTTSMTQSVACFGGNNGSAQVTPSGGTSPYTYLWNTGATTQAVSGLSQGVYTVTVTDANGCTNTNSVSISQPAAALSSSITSTQNVNCFGGANGSINLSVSGGTVPYTYIWNNGATTQDLSSLSNGSYTVTVTDARGCTTTRTITITQPAAALSASTTVTSNISCFSGNNGTVDLTVNGGTSPYFYSWSTGATTQDLSGLGAGTYTVTITDANGCNFITSATITQPAGALATSLTVSQNVSCFGGNNGNINSSSNGGTAPYTYSWSNGATTQNITGLSVGTYTVTVTDANGCSVNVSTVVSQPVAALSNTLAVTQNVSCFSGNNGAINLTVNGGTSPYSYSWSNGATIQDLSGIGSGTYTVTITDANGCTSTGSVTVTQPAASLAASSNVSQNVSCFGGNNGSISLTVNGGTAPYSYSWSNGSSSQNLSGLSSGSYTVTVYDANGCTATSNATISQPAGALTSTATVTQNVSCFAGSNGTIDVSVSGGTAPYTYSWNNGASTQDQSGLSSGTYTVTITDANGCTSVKTVSITQPAAALNTSAVVSQAVSCNGGSNGSINLSVTGGTSPYTYVWSNGATIQDITNLSAGTYTVTVTDANGCTSVTASSVTQPAQSLSGSTTVTSNISCFSGNNGSIDLTVAGGTSPYTFMWSTGAITEDLSGLPAGSYTVTITDANGCTATANGVIVQPAGALSANLTVSQNVACFGGGNGSFNLTVNGGTTPYTYSWSNGATTEDISNLAVGVYTVNITDANGCISSATGSITQPSAALSAAVSSNIPVSCFGGNDGSLDVTPSGGTAPYTYAWNTGATTQDINNLVTGSYTVTVTDANGCTFVQNALVSQPVAALNANAVASAQVACYAGSNGQVNLTVTGGTSPYTYSWNNGSVTEDLTGVSAGTYTVNITDDNGCNTTASVTVTEPAAAVSITTGSLIPVSCFGGNNGSASVVPAGGTAPYSYSWNNGATTSTINGVSTGTYTVTVTDNNGCSAISSVTISQPVAALSGVISPIQNVSCFGGGDGSANLTVSGGTVAYTYLWSNGLTTEDILGLASGTYTVTVTDANSCTLQLSLTITQPAASLSATSTVTANISCFSGNNGAIDLTVNGGTSPYTFIWSNGAITEDVSGLGAGTYTVTITDANGCTTTITDQITQPAGSLAATLGVSQPVSCFGGSNGSLNLTVNGGTAPYSFAWNNGATTEDISGLITGMYTVSVTDANGCITSQTAFINQPRAALDATLQSLQPALCFGSADGSIDITVTGGTTPYTYNWSNGATTEDLTGLGAGSYTVTVTDINGCTFVFSGTIVQPAAALSTVMGVVQNVLCNAGNSGSASVVINGGTAPYYISWSNGQNTDTISNLIAGWYTVSIIDANGCYTTDSIEVTQPAAALSSAINSVQQVNCFSNNTGSVNLDVTGGTSPYTFNWSNGATTEDISGLAAGTYSVIITDANGCTAVNTVAITQPSAALTAQAQSVQPALCFGSSDGSIDITANGGTIPYTYNWSNGATSEDITGLSAGTYTVTVTDINGCTYELTATITQPSAALSTGLSLAQQVNCFAGEDGAIDLTATGGTAPYTYNWSNGATTEDITDLMAGTYVVTVTDINGCSVTDSLTLTQPSAPLLGLATITSNVFCNGGSNGAIDLTVSGGTAPYTFNWNNGATTEDISGLSTGIFTVTITDINGCTTTVSAGIGQPSQQLSATSVLQNVLCFNGNNGTIDITPTGGTPPYSFNWSNGATTEDIGGLIAGTYTVTITDANGCDTTLSASVIQPGAPLIPSLTINQNVSCFGGNDGGINLGVTGGTPPYVYIWSNGATTQNINSLPFGPYTVTVTDANGCNAIISDFVSQPQAPLSSVITQTQPVSCFGGNNGSLICNPAGGTAPYTYVWSNGSTTQNISGLAAGTYTVTVTDSKGCTYTDSGTVTTPAASVSVSGVTTIANCLYGVGGSVTLTVNGGTPGYTYNWSNGATTQDLPNVQPGNYTVTVTDQNGCSATGTFTVGNSSTVAILPGPYTMCVGETITLGIDTIPGATYQWYYTNTPLTGATTNTFNTPAAGYYYITVTTACGTFVSDSVQVVVNTIDNVSIIHHQILCPPESVQLLATGGLTYEWSPNSFIDYTNIPNPTVNPEVSTTYSVVITNAYGCTTTLDVDVTVICDTLFIPNGFSPNDDGTNDGYVIDGIENYPGNKLWIYNRWGNLVFKTKNYNNKWDGIANVAGMYIGQKLPSGTYYYILDLNDGSRPHSGYLILRR